MGADLCKVVDVSGGEILTGKASADEQLEIPDAKVWIRGQGGEEALVEQGSLKFLDVKADTSSVKVLYIGNEVSDVSQGFFFPLSPQTAVVYRDGVICCDAGEGDVFGICLPPDIDDTTLEVLDELLWESCAFTSRRKPRTEQQRKAAEIERQGEALIAMIKEYEEKVSQGIKDAAKYGNETLGAHETKLPSAVKGGVKAVKGVTHNTVKMSEKLIGGILDVAAEAAKATAKGGVVAAKSVMPAPTPTNEPSVVGDAIAVGQAGCLVAVQVIDTLFTASDKLYLEAIDETEKLATEKYGKDVAKVTKDGMIVGKDVFDIYKLTGSGGGKAAAKTAVKKALAKKAIEHTAKGLASGVKEGLEA